MLFYYDCYLLNISATRIIIAFIAFAIAFPVIMALASTFIIIIVVPLLLLHFVITIWRIQSSEPVIGWTILHGDSLDSYVCDDCEIQDFFASISRVCFEMILSA